MKAKRNIYLKFVICIIWALITLYSLWCFQRYNIYTEDFIYDTYNIFVYLTPMLVSVLEIIFFKRLLNDNNKNTVNCGNKVLLIVNNLIFVLFTFCFFIFEKKYVFYEYAAYTYHDSFSFAKIILFSTIGIFLNLIPSNIILYRIFNKNNVKKSSWMATALLCITLILSIVVNLYVQLDIPEFRFVYGDIENNYYGIKSSSSKYSSKGPLVDYRDKSLKETIKIPRKIANKEVSSIKITPENSKTYFIPDSLDVSSLKYGWFEDYSYDLLAYYFKMYSHDSKVEKYGDNGDFYIKDNIIFDKETQVMDCSLSNDEILNVPKTIEIIASEISRIETIFRFKVEEGNKYFYSFDDCLLSYNYNDLVLEDCDRIKGISWELECNFELFKRKYTEKEIKETKDNLIICCVPNGKDIINLPEFSDKIVYVYSNHNKVKVNLSKKSKNVKVYGDILEN